MSIWLALVLISFLTWRGTRFVTKDDFPPVFWLRMKIIYARPPITRRRKTWVGSQWIHDPKQDDPDYWWFGELVTCPWCASAYISAVITALAWWRYDFPAPIMVWGAAWAVGAALAAKIN